MVTWRSSQNGVWLAICSLSCAHPPLMFLIVPQLYSFFFCVYTHFLMAYWILFTLACLSHFWYCGFRWCFHFVLCSTLPFLIYLLGFVLALLLYSLQAFFLVFSVVFPLSPALLVCSPQAWPWQQWGHSCLHHLTVIFYSFLSNVCNSVGPHDAAWQVKWVLGLEKVDDHRHKGKYVCQQWQGMFSWPEKSNSGSWTSSNCLQKQGSSGVEDW